MSEKNFRFSQRTAWQTEPNPLTRALESLRAQGKEILDLTVSNPTHCGFAYLNEELLKAFDKKENLAYEPDAHGLVNTRRAVASYYKKNFNAAVLPEQIFMTASTSEAYSFVLRLLADPHDAVLGPAPGYPLLDYLAGLHDVEIRRYPLVHKKRWETDTRALRDLCGHDVKAILLVHPGNPCGNLVSAAEKKEIVSLSAANSIPLVVDEVFLDYGFAESGGSFAETKETLTFTLSGVSKILGLPQMKLSWVVVSGPEQARKAAIEKLGVISDTYLSVSTPAQNALESWMHLRDTVQKEIKQRTAANLKAAASLPGLIAPEAGWYALLRMPGTRPDEEWALFLLEQAQVLTHPGYLFEFEESCWLVLSLLAPEKIFSEGVKRIAGLL